MRKQIAALLAGTALIAAVAAPAADAAGYGRGLFKGQMTSMFDSKRGKTPIEIKVKGSRVKVVKAVFVFNCAEDGSAVRKTVSTPYTSVSKGPAGGGAVFNGTVNAKEGGSVDVTFTFGLRRTSVSGVSDGTLDIQGLPCMDTADFKANRK